MDITGKTVLVLGGWGLVGTAVCRRLLEENPARIVVTSLNESEAREAAEQLQGLVPATQQTELVPWWGNIFARSEHRTTPREVLLANPATRRTLIQDVLEDLTEERLAASALHELLITYSPSAVVDCINTATAIAYQDIYSASRSVLGELSNGSSSSETVERLLAAQYTPQLIRHIQILYKGLKDCGAKMYVKIGTAGSGGMGLNIPYTHSEERPSRVLLSKSAVAGAQTLLLFLMARTPDGPIVKEIKPTATIAWKRIGNGEVLKRGKPIPLVDCSPDSAVVLENSFKIKEEGIAAPTGDTLKAPFVDTGENGIFARGEFEAISALGQMEMITPEEIAEAVVFELKGGNSGHDVVAALDGSVYGPTYRGGYLRSRAVETLKRLEEESETPSIAFEMLGPPRLSKLLFEAHIIGRIAGSIESACTADPAALSAAADAIVSADSGLRSRIISIGIPILFSDGKRLLRAESVKIPPAEGRTEIPVTDPFIEDCAHAGWVDLRAENFRVWQERFSRIRTEAEAFPDDDTSSRGQFTSEHWEYFKTVPAGKLVAWIFTIEDEGARMKA